MKNGKVKIDRGVPFPIRPVYADLFRKMKVSESVLFNSDGDQNSINSQAHRVFGKGNYSIRKSAEGYRVWRIK